LRAFGSLRVDESRSSEQISAGLPRNEATDPDKLVADGAVCFYQRRRATHLKPMLACYREPDRDLTDAALSKVLAKKPHFRHIMV
jgi:hypothetical protein